MRITLKGSLVLAALCAGMSGTQAYAQDMITARVPFDFQVNGQMFHAGRYQVQMNAGAGTSDLVALRGQDGKTFAFALTMPAGGRDPKGNEPALVFKRNETTYALSQIWESEMTGRELPRS